VENPDISSIFASPQGIVPPAPDKGFPTVYKLPSNQPYTDALSKLREDMSILANSNLPPTDTHLVDQANASAEAVKTSADKVAGNQIEEKYRTRDTVARFLKEPAVAAQTAIGGSGTRAANGAGRTFCDQVDQLRRFFPFNPSGPDLSMDLLNSTLGPGNDSALQSLIAKLSPQYVIKQGSGYVANDSAAKKALPGFLSSLNRMKRLSDTLYPNGSAPPHATYVVKQVSTNIDGLALKIGNDTLSGTGQQKSFTWSGTSEEVQVTAKDVLLAGYGPGPWAIFRFVNDGHLQGKPSEFSYTVKQSNGQDVLKNGQKEFYTFDVQFSGTTPVRLSDFSGLSCVSQVTHQ
jgi:type VI protein secretion system component VasK